MNEKQDFCLEVWGDYACFTRPEMKVERVSYDVITPSAARAIFSAILWKPAIEWHIKKIEVLNPIEWINIKRNEVGCKASSKEGFYADENRQQRSGMILKNVRYRIYANFTMTPDAGKDDTRVKFVAMFNRRAGRGQCYFQPYLGCREFSAHFKLITDIAGTFSQLENDTDDFNGDFTTQIAPIAIPQALNKDLGFMLYDMDYSNPQDIQPMFFRAKIDNGIIITDRKEIEVFQ